MTIRRTKRRRAKKSSKKLKRRQNNTRQLGGGDDIPFVIPSNDIMRLIRSILPVIIESDLRYQYYHEEWSDLMNDINLNKNAIYILLDNPDYVIHLYLSRNENIELYLEKQGIDFNEIYAETDKKEIAIVNEFYYEGLNENLHIYRLTKCFPFLFELTSSFSNYSNKFFTLPIFAFPKLIKFDVADALVEFDYTFPDALVKFDNRIFKHKKTADYLINRMGEKDFEYKFFNVHMTRMLCYNKSLVAMKLLNNVINANNYRFNSTSGSILDRNPFASEIFKNNPIEANWSVFPQYTNDIQFLKLHQNKINIDSLLLNHNREIFPLIEEMFNNSNNDLNYLMQIASNPHAIDLLKKHQDRLPLFHENICKNPRGFDLIVKLPLDEDCLYNLFNNVGVTNNFKLPLGKTINNTVILNNSLAFSNEHDLRNVKKAHKPKENDDEVTILSIKNMYGEVYTVYC